MFAIFRKKKKESSDTGRSTSPAARRIYVLDFDRTITVQHTGGIAYGPELSGAFVRKNVKKGFADFVRRVVGHGHAVYIASYSADANVDMVEEEALSGHDLIKFYMDEVFGPEQTIFRTPQTGDAGRTAATGNIIAENSQDYKRHHLEIILKQEGLDRENPADMKRIHLLEDDENIVRFFMDRGCTVIVPFSASRSADTAATRTLFTSYMPDWFIA